MKQVCDVLQEPLVGQTGNDFSLVFDVWCLVFGVCSEGRGCICYQAHEANAITCVRQALHTLTLVINHL